MFKFFGLGLEPTVRVQRERAEAGALLRLCCKHISKTRNAVKCERARYPGEFFIVKIGAKRSPAFVLTKNLELNENHKAKPYFRLRCKIFFTIHR